ncbi:hypothetical protein G9A89_023775 [Geosiphon pyriformis]|nr:hypothetical protein G9A89_023775 [Geosiphon pyriformis]
MSAFLHNKIHNFLINAEERHINATSVVHQGLEENPWIPKNDLRTILNQVVNYTINHLRADGSSRRRKLIKIHSQFEDAFEGVSTLYDLGVVKTTKEKPLSSDQIENNMSELKRKLQRDTGSLYQHLLSGVNGVSITELSWKDPLASQVVSDDCEFVNNLPANLKKGFMKPIRKMIPTSLSMVEEKCGRFVLGFKRHETKTKPAKLIHDGAWKESKEDIECVVDEILNVLKDIWNNSAFSPEFAETLNEGTYQSTVIVSVIRAALKNLPFGDSLFISTSEKQSIASADRKGEGHTGRRPDIMLEVKYLETVFELMYVECSRLTCTSQKKTDDEIKLWRETNDGLYWIRQTLKPDKDQFGVVGIQVAGNVLYLNLLLRDMVNVHRYFHLQSAEIPVQFSEVAVVTKFIETLLLLRNIVITNLSLLYHASVSSSERQMEGSTTVSTPRHY